MNQYCRKSICGRRRQCDLPVDKMGKAHKNMFFSVPTATSSVKVQVLLSSSHTRLHAHCTGSMAANAFRKQNFDNKIKSLATLTPMILLQFWVHKWRSRRITPPRDGESRMVKQPDWKRERERGSICCALEMQWNNRFGVLAKCVEANRMKRPNGFLWNVKRIQSTETEPFSFPFFIFLSFYSMLERKRLSEWRACNGVFGFYCANGVCVCERRHHIIYWCDFNCALQPFFFPIFFSNFYGFFFSVHHVACRLPEMNGRMGQCVMPFILKWYISYVFGLVLETFPKLIEFDCRQISLHKPVHCVHSSEIIFCSLFSFHFRLRKCCVVTKDILIK